METLQRYIYSAYLERQGFSDAGQASGWSLDALRWAVENGILSGKGGGDLDPAGLAPRAETAQMLKNFIEK